VVVVITTNDPGRGVSVTADDPSKRTTGLEPATLGAEDEKPARRQHDVLALVGTGLMIGWWRPKLPAL
jgi:hypothetical protein